MEELSRYPEGALAPGRCLSEKAARWTKDKRKGDIHREFGEELQRAYAAAGCPRLGERLLYGIDLLVCPDPNLKHQHPDADNISKTVWDSWALEFPTRRSTSSGWLLTKTISRSGCALQGSLMIAPTREDGPTLELPELTGAPATMPQREPGAAFEREVVSLEPPGNPHLYRVSAAAQQHVRIRPRDGDPMKIEPSILGQAILRTLRSSNSAQCCAKKATP